VARDLKLLLLGNRRADAVKLRAVKLDEPIAVLAVKVVVVWIAVFVFENAACAQREFANQPGFDQLAERSIDRRTAELPRRQQWSQMVKQLVGIEMVVMAENLLDD
jgi:hypothetical protein